MTDDELRAIRDRVDAASRSFTRCGWQVDSARIGPPGREIVSFRISSSPTSPVVRMSDGHRLTEFITQGPADIRALLAEVERLREMVDNDDDEKPDPECVRFGCTVDLSTECVGDFSRDAVPIAEMYTWLDEHMDEAVGWRAHYNHTPECEAADESEDVKRLRDPDHD